ncbi:MAG: type II secretion system F family protein [Defluviitaleaceae bacterium]|nr:type II secretion system F family protein [Defluviitaleaceae bacterium]
MPKYQFTAIDLYNKKLVSVIDARDEDDFRKQMRSRNLVPTKFKIQTEKVQGYKMRSNEVSEFCRQMASMLSSGITAVRAMEILKNSDFKPPVKKIFERMHKELQQGIAMSDSMRNQGNAFPVLLINMFASGEASGKLVNVTERMTTHYEKEHLLNGKIKAALRYPQILSTVTLIAVIGIFTIVLPSFFEMMVDFEKPTLTVVMIAFSDFLLTYWYILLIAVLVLIILARFLLSIHKVALWVDKVKLRLPVIGKLLKTIYTARFSRTLSSLYSSGVSIIASLEITGPIIMNKYIEMQFQRLVLDVRNGDSLSESVRRIDGFKSKLPDTILIGEESGRLDEMLVSTADSFEYEAEQAAGAMVQLCEPVMLVVLGGVILAVLLAVMLPMATLFTEMAF